ncbi:uncharacterized protein IL334_004096 [Kwoniella shivajii]|uniref:Integral membrane protein n=1 Tax=Kwoniella shivajii TaxID=564305 RepID=A0ABZ1D147_9TREE|nr:hypothetical protein IL334_004096 [Kwoniella shivajii]
MKERPAAENALATIGAVLWMVQILPQIIKSHRSKSTTGLSAGLMFIWALASLFLGSYLVAQRLSIPLQIQPQAFGVLAAVSTGQILYYSHNWSKKKAIWFFVIFCVIFAGFEAGSVYALWAGQDNGVNWPIQMYGYISAVLLAAALGPQFYEIWKFKEVLGISMLFMIVDTLGGVFSLASLFCRADLDIAGAVSYALVVVLDSIVVILALILNPLAKRRRVREGKPANVHEALSLEAAAEQGQGQLPPPTAAGDGMGEGLGRSVSSQREQEKRGKSPSGNDNAITEEGADSQSTIVNSSSGSAGVEK